MGLKFYTLSVRSHFVLFHFLENEDYYPSLRKTDLPGIQLKSSTLFISVLLILHLFVGGTVGRGEWYFKYSDFKQLRLNWHVYPSSLRMKTAHLLSKEIFVEKCWARYFYRSSKGYQVPRAGECFQPQIFNQGEQK